MCTRHCSRRTEEAWLQLNSSISRFHNGTGPSEMTESDVSLLLTHLGVGASVAASTQDQALTEVPFLCEYVPERLLDRIEGVVRARNSKRLPVVLTRAEVETISARLVGAPRLICMLLYESGMRLLGGLRLRVNDLDFGRGEITVRQGKGQKDRVSMLPGAVFQSLQVHLGRVREKHAADLKNGLRLAPISDALARKYPSANREWGWQWVFPVSTHYLDRITGTRHRHRLHESLIQEAVHEAAPRAGRS